MSFPSPAFLPPTPLLSVHPRTSPKALSIPHPLPVLPPQPLPSCRQSIQALAVLPTSSSTPAPAATQSSALRLYNTLTRQKEAFVPLDPPIVKFYTCGPTVYDYAHIGNFRAFLTYDVVVRYLRYRQFSVRHVMNLTDVDDKIIARASATGVTPTALTERFAAAFFDDLSLLNVVPAEAYPRATECIDDIGRIVRGLRDKGVAYEVEGSEYFSVKEFPQYGRLAELDKREARGERGVKEDVRDFALWKAWKKGDGDVAWEVEGLAKGRPGWHVECTCMAMKYLGEELDIHGGGVDLVFPHHENEIAQAEALTGKPFSKYWIHNGFVNVGEEKMSKSLGNFRTLRDVVMCGEDARAFRYLVVSSQYRSALAFTPDCLEAARRTVRRIDTVRGKLQKVGGAGEEGLVIARKAVGKAVADFEVGMDDDFNTPRAAAAMFSIVNVAERLLKTGQIEGQAAKEIIDCLERMDRVFGIFYEPVLDGEEGGGCSAVVKVEVTDELKLLLEERQTARKDKNWGRADEIRNELEEAGLAVVDTPDGPELKRIDS